MKIVSLILLFLIFSGPGFAQPAVAEKIDEFGRLPCGDYMARADNIWYMQQAKPGSKIYIIYYEGKNGYAERVWDKKLKKYKNVEVGPLRGNALNYARGIGILLRNTRQFSESNIVLVDGGYEYGLELELWIVPPGAETPKGTPTLEEKDITFRKGKSPGPFDCTHAYDDI